MGNAVRSPIHDIKIYQTSQRMGVHLFELFAFFNQYLTDGCRVFKALLQPIRPDTELLSREIRGAEFSNDAGRKII